MPDWPVYLSDDVFEMCNRNVIQVLNQALTVTILAKEDETTLKISMEVTTCMEPILEEDYPEHTTLLVFDPWGTHTTKLPKVEIQLTQW